VGKKKTKKVSKKSRKRSSFILTIFLITLVLLFILSKDNNFLKQPSQTISKVASPSAQAKPTPTPIPIPAQSGRSVRVPILTYHYIGNNPNPADKARDNLSVAPDKFEEQLGYISKNGYNTITFDTLYAALNGTTSLPAKSVILTFDDGYMDFYYNAYQALKRFNLHATVFIPTALMGGSYYLTWDQIREMNSSGLISFQSHSVNHLNLTALSDEQLKFQLIESKKVLEAQLGKAVNTFAYPYGASDQRVWNAVKKAGYVGAVGTWYGIIESEGTILDMPRVKIGGGENITSFASKL